MSELSETTFFLEFQEAKELIQSLSATTDGTPKISVEQKNPTKDACSNQEERPQIVGDAALARLRIILDKYLECPTLLDPKLEAMADELATRAANIVTWLYHNHPLKRKDSNDRRDAAAGTGTVSEDGKPNDSKEKEERVDEDEALIHVVMSDLRRHLAALYALSKVRGKKQVQKFLSHEAAHVEPVLFVLSLFEEEKRMSYEQQQQQSMNIPLGAGGGMSVDGRAHTWEAIYALLLWLGMLSLVPFDLNTIDSSHVSSSSSRNGMEQDISNGLETKKEKTPVTLISSMLTSAREHLSDIGVTREVAASTLASLLSRPDLEEVELRSFVTWSNSILEGYYAEEKKKSSNSSLVLLMGVVQTLATLFKTASRSNLIQRHLSCIELLWERAIRAAHKARPDQDSTGGSAGGALILRKLLVKLFARVGCAHLPPRVAPWRYQRGKRSLLQNLKSSTCAKEPEGKVVVAPTQSYSKTNITSDEQLPHPDIVVPDQVEDSMDQLIQSLTDPATVVRWSAAKGIGRVTERLPLICAEDVLDAILLLCEDFDNDNAWHGSCLALAELARRGLLLPSRLEQVVPIVTQAIQYDLPRGQHSVGAHVRDAACYTCWAFARAYSPKILQPHVHQLGKSIVLATLFDREVNCRRAASAAFQECVGRQGADNFKHGIKILTAADYFSVGNRADAYTSVALQVAHLEEYRRPIIDHLVGEKLFHWDEEIRIISCDSLRNLTALDPIYFIETVLPDLIECCTNENLFVRHGAVSGLAEVVLALGIIYKSTMDTPLGISDNAVLRAITNLVTTIEKARLYRGRGGEIMRAAVSRYIQCVSLSGIPLTIKQQLTLLDSLDENLKHPNENIQKAAAKGLAALMLCHFPIGRNGPSDRLQDRVVDKYIGNVLGQDNPAATRGFALALGHLPPKLLAPNAKVLGSILECLIKTSNPVALVGGQGDAETRRNSIQSLVSVCEAVGLHSNNDKDKESTSHITLTPKQLHDVFQALLDATEDYNTDRRGDVGSWSRIAAMIGLEKLSLLAAKGSTPKIPQFFSSQSKSNVKPFTLVPPLCDRLSFLESNITNKVKICVKDNIPMRDVQETRAVNYLFTDEVCAKVIGALLKQLSEKLNAVRLQAGQCLERLLVSTNPLIPFVPCRKGIVAALELNEMSESSKKNWGNPSETFPLVMRVAALGVDAFFDNIMSGIVISCGGLTESVTKEATKSLLDYLRCLKSYASFSNVGDGKNRR